jgi:hypothetical protein
VRSPACPLPAAAATAPPVMPLTAVSPPVVPPHPLLAVTAVVAMAAARAAPVASILAAVLRLLPQMLRLFPGALRCRMGLLITHSACRWRRGWWWQQRTAWLAASSGHGSGRLSCCFPGSHRSQDGRIIHASWACVAGPVTARLGCSGSASPGVLPTLLLQDSALRHRDTLRRRRRRTGGRSSWFQVGAGKDAALLLHLPGREAGQRGRARHQASVGLTSLRFSL